jgi:hypothetical protein
MGKRGWQIERTCALSRIYEIQDTKSCSDVAAAGHSRGAFTPDNTKGVEALATAGSFGRRRCRCL